MCNKRGISPIIATVLLLGFAIALATTVFLWMHGQTKTMSKSTVEYVEGEMQCQNIRINLLKTDGKTCNNLDVSNKGYLVINQLSIKVFPNTGDSPELQNVDLSPQSNQCQPTPCGITTKATHCGDCEKVEVMPIITIGERLVGCKDKILAMKCQEICGNAMDDDEDGLIDCHDTPQCAACP